MIMPLRKLQKIKHTLINEVYGVFHYYKLEYKCAEDYAKEKKDIPTEYNYWSGYRDGIVAATIFLLRQLKKIKKEYEIKGDFYENH